MYSNQCGFRSCLLDIIIMNCFSHYLLHMGLLMGSIFSFHLVYNIIYEVWNWYCLKDYCDLFWHLHSLQFLVASFFYRLILHFTRVMCQNSKNVHWLKIVHLFLDNSQLFLITRNDEQSFSWVHNSCSFIALNNSQL